jgi:hypothetical protein
LMMGVGKASNQNTSTQNENDHEDGGKKRSHSWHEVELGNHRVWGMTPSVQSIQSDHMDGQGGVVFPWGVQSMKIILMGIKEDDRRSAGERLRKDEGWWASGNSGKSPNRKDIMLSIESVERYEQNVVRWSKPSSWREVRTRRSAQMIIFALNDSSVLKIWLCCTATLLTWLTGHHFVPPNLRLDDSDSEVNHIMDFRCDVSPSLIFDYIALSDVK